MMKLTLLIDLDDTLVSNPMDRFIENYFKLFGGFIKDIADPQAFIQAILKGTDAMLANQDPNKTLREVFNEIFFPIFPMDEKEAQPIFDQFYSEIFIQLKDLCPPIPGAQQFIKDAVVTGHELVIATNPIFPLLAIEHRLNWAELAVPIERFSLITNYETSHYAKPHPSYFAECLARLGWSNQPAVMIGNDPENDIAGAQKLGLPTYHVIEDRTDFETTGERSAKGPIAKALDWIGGLNKAALQPRYTTKTGLEAILLASLAAMDHKKRTGSPYLSENEINLQKEMQESLGKIREKTDLDYEAESSKIFKLVGVNTF